MQMTFDRFKNITTEDKIWVVSNEKYGPIVSEQLPELKTHQILLETEKRNTAPCIAYAAHKIMKEDPNAVLIVRPSDHAIFKEKEFLDVMGTAVESAETNDQLITIGIRPHRPETGYGYIQMGEALYDGVKQVEQFREKPDRDTAQSYIDSLELEPYLWCIYQTS